MTPIQTDITFRGLTPSESLESDIRKRVAWLAHIFPTIMRCSVLVEVPHRHQRQGRRFHVRIELTVPGAEPIVISHEPLVHGRVKDAEGETHRKSMDTQSVHRYGRVAVYEAFDDARRRLEDLAREQRGAVKVHKSREEGEVAEVSTIDGYGFIESEGARIYFNRASVLDEAFDRIAVGTRVAFVEERGEKGPQASTVRVLRDRRSRGHHAAS